MLYIPLAIYLCILAVVFLTQRRFLYHPRKASLESSLPFAALVGLDPWYNAAGNLIGWKRLSGSQAPHDRVLVLHGNAGSAANRAHYALNLAAAEPCDVFILEYPGYGPRPGSPNQAAILKAADEAFTLLEKSGAVRLIGESLGTGVASYLAGAHPTKVSGVLLIAPYHNLPDAAQYHMPFFLAKWLLRDRFPAASWLDNYHGPLAVVLGTDDIVIPMRFSRRLFDAYAGPKKLWEIPGASHDDLANRPAAWWKELLLFWERNPAGGVR
jgi:pimeloyl-ACP methyl ester carboxylesterase